jgi:hypothetical protein
LARGGHPEQCSGFELKTFPRPEGRGLLLRSKLGSLRSDEDITGYLRRRREEKR